MPPCIEEEKGSITPPSLPIPPDSLRVEMDLREILFVFGKAHAKLSALSC